MYKKTISIIGLGYIGLPTAAVLASKGYTVLGYDLNPQIVNSVNNGKAHIFESNLDALVSSVVGTGHLKAFKSPQPADVYMVCVPTPIRMGKNIPEPDISFVLTAVMSIKSFIKSGDLLIIESTCPVGTTEMIRDLLLNNGVDTNSIHIAYCPERVLPGNILHEIVMNDRIIGGLTSSSAKVAGAFYRTFVTGEIKETEAKTAEMCKLAENSFRDLNIAFANELSIICDKQGIDTKNLIQLANRHPRVNILDPSVGVGGHCIAVDPWFIVANDVENTGLIQQVRRTNEYKTQWVINKIKSVVLAKATKTEKAPVIACLGLTYKANIDDLRESPALKITQALIDAGLNVLIVEPHIHSHPQFDLIELSQAINNADIFAILVKHHIFLEKEVKLALEKKEYIDFCGLF